MPAVRSSSPSQTKGTSQATIPSLYHHRYSHPHSHSISRPPQAAAIGRPSTATGTIRSPPYCSTAVYSRPAAVLQGRREPKTYYCTPYLRGVTHETLRMMGSSAPAECVLPRHSVSAAPPFPGAGMAVPLALTAAGPSCGSPRARPRRRCRRSATTCSTR